MSKVGRAPWTHMSHFLDMSHCALNSLPLCSFMAFLWGHFSATIRSVSNSCSSRRRRGRSPRSPPDIIDPQRTLLHFAGAPSLPGVMCWIITTMQCVAHRGGESSALGCSSSAPWCIDRVQTSGAPDNPPTMMRLHQAATRMRCTATRLSMMQPHLLLTRLHCVQGCEHLYKDC